MNRKLIQKLGFLLVIGLMICSSSCQNKAKEDTTTFDQASYNEQVEGVYEYTNPYQGFIIMINNHYLFMFGETDSTMTCHAGGYEIDHDTIMHHIQFASDPERVGISFKWKSERLTGDTILATAFDAEGNVDYTLKLIKKVDANIDNLNFVNSYDGVFQYLPPRQGLGIDFEGYWVYLGGRTDTTMYAHAGTYTESNDTITNSILFALNHKRVGSQIRWTSEAIQGDTLQWFTFKESGEISATGYSLKLK